MPNDEHIAGEEIVIREKIVGFGFDIRKGWPLVLLLIAVVVAAVVLVWPRGEREPEYQGKKLSEWIGGHSDVSHRDVTRSERAERDKAVKGIGTNALPFLVKWIKAARYVTEDTKLDGVIGKVIGTNSKRPGVRTLDWWKRPRLRMANGALYAFRALGDEGSPAIPELVELARGTNFMVSMLAFEALRGIGKSAVPALNDLPESPGSPEWVARKEREALESYARRMLHSSYTNIVSGKSE